jgi:NAD(P)H-flavin reductase
VPGVGSSAITYSPARLVGRESAGGGLTRLRVQPSPDVVASYVSPGQYVEMRVGREVGFFVVSSDPGDATWAFVMRPGGGVSDVVLGMPVGAELEITGPLGPGFPMEATRGKPLVVALAGTGVAAGPPIVGRRVRDDNASITRVLLGVRNAGELPIPSELDAWTRAGVGLTIAVSRIDPAHLASDGRLVCGRVHDAMLSGLGPRAPDGTTVFAVGSEAMLEAVREVAATLGIAADRVHANH